MNYLKQSLFFLLILLFTLSCHNQKAVTITKQDGNNQLNDDNFEGRLWKDAGITHEKLICPGKIIPLSYRMLDTDTAAAKQLLLIDGPAPGLVSTDTILLDIPIPDGTWEKYRINQVQVMAPELAAKYPGIKTYSGVNVVFPADQIRLEVNPQGLRGMVLSDRGTILLDMYCENDIIHMISFFKKYLPEGSKEDFENK